MTPPRMLVCDVDGTLLDSGGRLSEPAANAVRVLDASGVGVVLATGRILAGVAPLCRRLGLTGPQIMAHGGLVATPAGAVISELPLSATDVRAHVAFGRELGAPTILCWADRVVADRITSEVVAAFVAYDEPEPEVSSDLGALADSGPLKTTLCVGVEECERARGTFLARFGDRYTATSANGRELELLAAEATKAAAAQKLAAMLGISMSDVAAVGDGDNDVDLFGVVGVSAAMANASPEVRARASFVVPSCDEDGVVVAIARLFPGLSL